MKQDWEGEGVEHLWNWAEYAAGMIINITLKPQFWKFRRGHALLPVRYSLSGDLGEQFSNQVQEFYKGLKKLPKEHHPEFSKLPLDDFATIINNTRVNIP